MDMKVRDGAAALTEKEKQTLRLIVRGHDAKSVARSLDLSVHTINERLREARRKMSVSSSREAARLLLDIEGQPTPDLSADTEIGDDADRHRADRSTAPIVGAGRIPLRSRIIIGVLVMTLFLGLLAMTALPHAAVVAPQTPTASSDAADADADAEVVDSARRWLVLVDQGKWDESYKATGAAFRDLNTADVWATVSRKVRVPLGALVSRTFVSQENLPAPPSGYEVVKFRTSFANKADALETVSLIHEGGMWRVVGITVG